MLKQAATKVGRWALVEVAAQDDASALQQGLVRRGYEAKTKSLSHGDSPGKHSVFVPCLLTLGDFAKAAPQARIAKFRCSKIDDEDNDGPRVMLAPNTKSAAREAGSLNAVRAGDIALKTTKSKRPVTTDSGYDGTLQGDWQMQPAVNHIHHHFYWNEYDGEIGEFSNGWHQNEECDEPQQPDEEWQASEEWPEVDWPPADQ